MRIQLTVFLRYLPEGLQKGLFKIYVYLALNSLIVSYVFYRNQRSEVIQNMLCLKQQDIYLSIKHLDTSVENPEYKF